MGRWNNGTSSNSTSTNGRTVRYFKTGSVSKPKTKKRARRASSTSTSSKSSFKSKSGSSTKTKKSKKTVTVKSPSYGMSNSFASLKYKKLRIVKQSESISSPAVYEKIDPQSIGSTLGTQGIGDMHILYSAVGTAIPGITAITDLFNQAMEVNNVTPAAVGPFIGAGQRSFKFVLDNANVVTTMSNVAVSTCDVEIWDLVAKTTSATYASPQTCWATGAADEIGPYSYSRNNPYAVPTSSKLFNITWRVIKKTKLELGAGRSHKHTFTFSPNVIVDSEYWANYPMVKGLTCSQMVIIRGQPVDTAAGLGFGTVTLSPTKVDCIIRVRYTTRSLFSHPRTLQQIDNVSTAAATTYTFSEGAGQVINEVTGALLAAPAG